MNDDNEKSTTLSIVANTDIDRAARCLVGINRFGLCLRLEAQPGYDSQYMHYRKATF